MNLKRTVLSALLAVGLCSSSFAAMTIDGAGITFSDSSVQTTAATGGGGGTTQYHVVHVSADSDPGTNATNLANAISAIIDADWSNRYVIQLDPGQYFLGASALTMKQYVNIHGMGQDVTRINGTGAVIINGTDSSSLHSLTVSSDATISSSVVVLNGGEMTMDDVSINHNGGGTNTYIALDVTGGGGVELHNFNIEYWNASPAAGTFIGISLTGYGAVVGGTEGSWADCNAGYIEGEDDGGLMTFWGVKVGDGTTPPLDLLDPITIDLGSGTFAEMTSAASKATGVKVYPEGLAFLMGAVVAGDETNDTYEACDALNSTGTVFSINTVFIGALVTTDVVTTTYSQCTKVVAGFDFAPIQNTIAEYAPL